MLNPDNQATLALPPDDQLTGELTAPTWDLKAGGRIKVEEKAKVKARLGRSTDVGDAVVQACCRDLLGPVVPMGPITIDARVSPWTRYYHPTVPSNPVRATSERLLARRVQCHRRLDFRALRSAGGDGAPRSSG